MSNEGNTDPTTGTPPSAAPPEESGPPDAGPTASEAPAPPPGDAAPAADCGGVPDLRLDGDELVVGTLRFDVHLLRSARTEGGRLAAEAALRIDLRTHGVDTATEDRAVALVAERLV